MVIDHDFYMSLALKEAWKHQGLTYPNPVVGALILDKNGKILSLGVTQEAGNSHAELQAIENAFSNKDANILSLKNPNEKHAYLLQHHDDYFKGCTIYVTLEPCCHHGKTPPCSTLIETLGFSHLVCGTNDPNKEASGSLKMLQKSGIKVTAEILKKECETLLVPFKKWQKEKPFVFFKLALSANGVYDGGVITSLESRTHVHKLRHNIDLLVIGGESVRSDRPTLDSRLVGGKAPDVLILSHHKKFDKTIPLFTIPNRKVFIEENFDKIANYRFIMIEGAQTMMQASSQIVDWYCTFVSPSFKKGKTIQLSQTFKRLQLLQNQHDSVIWYASKGEIDE